MREREYVNKGDRKRQSEMRNSREKETKGKKSDILQATKQEIETGKRESMQNTGGLRMSVEQTDVWAQYTSEYCKTFNY